MTRDECNKIHSDITEVSVFVISKEITVDSYVRIKSNRTFPFPNMVAVGSNTSQELATIPAGTKVVIMCTNAIESIGPTIIFLDTYKDYPRRSYEIEYADIEFLEDVKKDSL